MSASEPLMDTLANEICRAFDKRSPFGFVSGPTEPRQRFVGVFLGKPKIGIVEFSARELVTGRADLIDAIRRKGAVISDLSVARGMSPGLKAIYDNSEGAIALGLDLPPALKLAFVDQTVADCWAATAV